MPSFPGVGERIGRFRILARLGSGAMGVVYEALEENLERRVALKVIAPVHAEDPDFRERFAREARALASLDSPHVVQVYAHGEEDGHLYLATQLIPDGDLAAMIARWGPAPLGRAVELVEQVASGLADAHAAGLVHRDIKAANVLVRRRGSGAETSVAAYLGDFGIARRIDAEATRVGGAALGTPAYMAPELHHGAPASPASDVYAVGCLLWVVLTGAPPFAGATELEVINGHLAAPVPQLVGASPLVVAIDDALRRCLAKDPAERHQHAAALRDDLRRAAALRGDVAWHEPARRAAVAPAPVMPAPPPYGVGSVGSGDAAGSTQGSTRASVRGRRTGLRVGAAAAALVVAGGVVAAVVLDRDGSSGAESSAQDGSDAETDAGTAGFVDQDAETIMTAAEKEMKVLDSVRVAGSVVDGGEVLGVDLTITARGDCDGTLTSGDGSAQLRRVGSQSWFLADEAFWVLSTDAALGPVVADVVGQRWVAVSRRDAVDFADICDLDELLETTNDSVIGEVLGTDRLDEQEVVRVTTGTGDGESVAFVAVEEPHYLLRLDGGLDGNLSFSDFDEPFTVEPPPADEIADLRGLLR